MGRITLLVGPGGLGKSFLITDLAARVSTGSPWPDGNGNAPLGSVILISAEDDPADTIRPRLDAHLADVSHVHMLSAVRWLDAEAKPKERMFSLADLPALETALQTHRDCKLVVVDPIGSFLGSDTDAHRDNEVRAILAPIAKLAERYAVAMLVIAHRRKAAGTLADDLALGSRAFTALARACWHLSRDPDNRERRLLLAGKNNLAKAGDGMAFTIAGDPPRIEWEREPVQMSADEALAHENDTHGPEPTERAGAEEWLREFLAKGPMRAGDIEKPEPGTIRYEAKTAGIKWATLRRAKVTVRAKAYRDFGVWFWKLPEPPLDPVQGAQNNLSHLHLTEKDEPLEPLEGNTRENTPQDALVNQVAHVLFPTRVRAREDEPQPPTPEDTAFRREERAAILEYDAGMTRAQAQEAAIAHDPHQTAPDAPGTIRRPSQDAEDHPTAGKPGKDKRP